MKKNRLTRTFFLLTAIIMLFGNSDTIIGINVESYQEIVDGKFTSIEDVKMLFNLDVKEIEEVSQNAISLAQNGLDKIISIANQERTFDNTARALDDVSRRFSVIHSMLQTLKMVSPQKEIRDAVGKSVLEMSNFLVDAFMNKSIYEAFKFYSNDNAQEETLTDEHKYYLDEEMECFKRSGFNLSDEVFEKVKLVKKELAKLYQDFSIEIAQDKSSIIVEESGLVGVSKDFIKRLKKDSNGDYILDCTYPTRLAVMSHCKIEDTRMRWNRAFKNRAYPANFDRLNIIIAKRDELANLLAKKSFADLDIGSHMMIKSSECAEAFLISLNDKAQLKNKEEFDEMTKELPEGVALTEDGKLKSWDLWYVSECYKKKNYNIDEREIAEYFPVEKTLEGVFSIYQDFLGLDFKMVDASGMWHEDVRCIEVCNSDDKMLRGYIFLDLFPRQGKYTHACMMPVVHTLKREAGLASPSVCIVITNFPKPTADKPSLLTHAQVKTFFHEFGHGMHHLLGCTDLDCFSGTSVKRDFVEMPSQILEEWMWDKNMLQKVSCHYKTGKPLPDQLIDKKIVLKQFGTGGFVCGQSVYGLLALSYFAPGAEKDTDAILQNLYEKYYPTIAFDNESHFQANFAHLIHYGAKYYTYLWSKVLALDLFEEIKKHGLLDHVIGSKFKKEVLGKGGSVDPDKIVYNFLGREPNHEAFLADMGLVKG